MNKSFFDTPAVILSEPPNRFEQPYARRCFRVLRMVTVLHGKGFHGLRVFPYEYPLAYRIELFPDSISDQTGVRYRHDLQDTLSEQSLIARHSGANEAAFFGWKDVASSSAQELAVVFIRRFPKLAKAAYHLYFACVGWYSTLMAHCEYGYLPYLFSDDEEMVDAIRLRAVAAGLPEFEFFPFPPAPDGGNALFPSPKPDWL